MCRALVESPTDELMCHVLVESPKDELMCHVLVESPTDELMCRVLVLPSPTDELMCRVLVLPALQSRAVAHLPSSVSAACPSLHLPFIILITFRAASTNAD
jgi:hypothetical protein